MMNTLETFRSRSPAVPTTPKRDQSPYEDAPGAYPTDGDAGEDGDSGNETSPIGEWNQLKTPHTPKSESSPPVQSTSTDQNGADKYPRRAEISGDENELGSLMNVDAKELLSLVDEIRKIEALRDTNLNLPQIVVVGNTSSGKSSLLQALTRLPFPVNPDLCTRFVTETTISKCKERPGYTITVASGTRRSSGPRHFDKKEYTSDNWLDVYRHLKDDILKAHTELSNENVPIESASTRRLSGAHSPRRSANRRDKQPQLLDDVLQISVLMPEEAHFSVIDIPGLVTNGADDDVELSVNLAMKYIGNARAIVLAVINALDAIDNQKVLSLVRKQKAEDRTIGVVTKCDRVEDLAATKVLKMLRNESKSEDSDHLTMGWYAVRNRAPDEVRDEDSFNDRDLREATLFSKGIWKDSTKAGFSNNSPVSRAVLGIDNLKVKLSQALLNGVKEGFPSLRNEMREMKEETERQLHKLGASRNSDMLQRVYIHNIQVNYQAELERSLRGDYRRDIGENHPSKLSLHIQELNRKFNEDMIENGAKHPFSPPTGENKPLVSLNGEALRVDEGILQWIHRVCRNTRGSEPQHDLPPLIKPTLFSEQIESWEGIAHSYLAKVEKVIEECAQHLFTTACEDGRLRSKLRLELHDAYHEGLKRAHDELSSIIRDNGYLRTWNPMLDIRINELSALREPPVKNFYANGIPGGATTPNNPQSIFGATAPLTSPPVQGPSTQTQGIGQNQGQFGPVSFGQNSFGQNPAQPAVPNVFNRPTSSASAAPHVSDTAPQSRMGLQQAGKSQSHVSEKDVIKLHDWIWAYYDVALPRFVDNVTTQVVQRHLMGKEGPIRVFNGDWVLRLKSSELEDLAGEDEDTKLKRVMLQERLDGLEDAIQRAKRVLR